MSMKYITAHGLGIKSRDGGTVAFHRKSEGAFVSRVMQSSYGVSVGPLDIQTPTGAVVGIRSIEFLPERSSSATASWKTAGGSMLAGGAATHGSDDEDSQPSVSRRDWLKTSLVALGVGSAAASAAAETKSLKVAELVIERNDGGFRIKIAPLVDGVLPDDAVFAVSANGVEIGTFESNGTDGVSVGPQLTGTISVHLKSDASLFEDINALVEDSTLEYEYDITNPASAYSEGSEIVLTSNPVVVECLRDSGSEGSVMTLGDSSVPHKSEDDEPIGQYYVSDESGVGSVVYQVGSQPTDARKITLSMRVGKVEEVVDDVNRSILN